MFSGVKKKNVKIFFNHNNYSLKYNSHFLRHKFLFIFVLIEISIKCLYELNLQCEFKIMIVNMAFTQCN